MCRVRVVQESRLFQGGASRKLGILWVHCNIARSVLTLHGIDRFKNNGACWNSTIFEAERLFVKEPAVTDFNCRLEANRSIRGFRSGIIFQLRSWFVRGYMNGGIRLLYGT